MKKSLIILSIAAAGFMSFAPAVKKSETFKVDSEKSKITWKAKKVTGQHDGTLQISSGTLKTENDVLRSGTFIIDMSSITVEDQTGKSKDALTGHLKSDDFFSVEKHPTSQLEITKVSKDGNSMKIDGNLTIKGITKPISFPAAISMKGNILVAVSTITVDRTNYDIRYRSKNYFEDLGDKAIDNEFEVTVNLVASK